MILDFKEIPKANGGDGLQDTFEFFSRDFLELFGFEILQDPNRGMDGKKDLIVQENRVGISGTSVIRWIVSCKHNAFSGKSVNDTDEPDLMDRVKKHKCDGFIGFYSTITSTALSSKFEGLKDKIEYVVFDREKIERRLLESPEGIHLARRYFPISIEKFIKEHPTPAKIYAETPEIKCECCGKNLLENAAGIWVEIRKLKEKEVNDKTKVYDLYFSCKGKCDFYLKHHYRNKGFSDGGWMDINDLKNPALFLYQLVGYINRHELYDYQNEAHAKMKELFINALPYICRELTPEEKERASMIVYSM